MGRHGSSRIGGTATARGAAAGPAALAALLGACLAVSACEPCAGVSPCRDEPTAEATGQLVERESGEPRAGVALTFVPRGGVELGRDDATTTTGADGRYHATIPAARTGGARVDVRVEPPGHPPYTVEGLRIPASRTRGEGVDLGRWLVDPYHALLGEVRMRSTGAPPTLRGEEGARVVFRRTGGVVAERDSLSTFTDGAGRFVLLPGEAPPGPIAGRVTITHPDFEEPWTFHDVVIDSEHRDGPLDVDRVFSRGPSLNWAGVIVFRNAGGQTPAADTRVTFQRTGGIPVSPDTFTVTTQPWGGFSLFTRTREEGVVIGELIVDPPPPRSRDTIPEVRMPTYDSGEQRVLKRWAVGEQINHVGLVFVRSAGEWIPADSVQVRLRRVGGIEVETPTSTVATTYWGAFPIKLATDQEGALRLEAEVLLDPPRGPARIEDLEVETFAADSQRVAGRWAFGEQINHALVFERQGTGEPVAGVEVEFRRTGGIRVRPDTFTVTTTSWGAAPIQTHTDEEGVLEGEVEVRMPEGPVLIEGLRLETFAADELRHHRTYRIP